MKKEPSENYHLRTIYLPAFFQTHPEISLALIYLKTFVKRVAVMTAIDTEALARKLSIYFQWSMKLDCKTFSLFIWWSYILKWLVFVAFSNSSCLVWTRPNTFKKLRRARCCCFFYLNCKLYHIMHILVITFDTLRIEDEKKDIRTKIFRFAILA